MNETNTGSITNFDYWKSAYAGRASNLSVSEVRALFAVVSRPEVVSLAGGMPDVSELPTDGLNKGLNIRVRPSQSEQPSGERLLGCLNDRSSHLVGISVRRGSSVLQPSYPAVCMRRHRNPDRSPSV